MRAIVHTKQAADQERNRRIAWEQEQEAKHLQRQAEMQKELEDMKNAPFARTVDDTAMNEELRAKELWNDPAAAFLTVSLFSVPSE